MNLGRSARRVATILATALLASGACAATAGATAGNIVGPSELHYTASSFTTPTGVFVNTKLDLTTPVEAPGDGVITSWSANFYCYADPCTGAGARLEILRPTSDPTVFTAVGESDFGSVSDSGVAGFTTSLPVREGDLIGIKPQNVEISFKPVLDAEWTSGSGIVSGSLTAPTRHQDMLALFNATFDPQAPTETSVTATPNPVLEGGAVSYTASVSQTGVAGCTGGCGGAPSPTGTVAFTDGGQPVAGCGAVALTGGAATCATTAQSPRGGRQIVATYSGDDDNAGSSGLDNLRVVAATTVTAAADPSPVARRAAITYTATISPTPFLITSDGLAHSANYSGGSVAFSVDGAPVADCAAVSVASNGRATCVSTAPPLAGTHTLTASFGGSTYNSAAAGSAPFEVIAPKLSIPDADFGAATVGSSRAKTVTITNADEQAVTLADITLAGDGAFAIAGNGCSGVTLAPGAACDVQLTFAPGAATAYAGTLKVADTSESAPRTAALTGSGTAAPAPPSAPVPPKQPGGVLAPGKSSTLTVTTSAPSDGGTPTATVAVPLSCPANETCELDGRVTISTSTLSKAARAAATSTTTVARFSKVHIAAGKVKTVKLELSPAFIKKAQKQGIRRIKATLTINTTLGSGQKATTRQQITVLLPKAPKKKAAAPKARPHFTG